MTLELRPLGVKCNIQCQYCYQNPQRDAGKVTHHYDLDRMKAAATELGGEFTLFGGEPLLLPEADLEDLWAWGYARNGRNGIQTNGTLINNTHIRLLKKYNTPHGDTPHGDSIYGDHGDHGDHNDATRRLEHDDHGDHQDHPHLDTGHQDHPYGDYSGGKGDSENQHEDHFDHGDKHGDTPHEDHDDQGALSPHVDFTSHDDHLDHIDS